MLLDINKFHVLIYFFLDLHDKYIITWCISLQTYKMKTNTHIKIKEFFCMDNAKIWDGLGGGRVRRKITDDTVKISKLLIASYMYSHF